MAKTYDSRCFDLAEAFLEDGLIGIDHQKHVIELAQHIQSSIEDWIAANPPNLTGV